MRISTGQIFASGLSSMLEQQAKLAKTQEQVATGNKILSPSDDPVGSVRGLELNRSLERTQQFQRNANILDSRLSLEEGMLANSVDILQRVRELALQANNATQSNESRAAIASEVSQQLDMLLGYANTQDPSGNYIFGGHSQGDKPFDLVNGEVVYRGDDGQRALQIGPAAKIADGDPGSKVFMQVASNASSYRLAQGESNGVALSATTLAQLNQFSGDTVTIAFTQADEYQVVDAAGNVLSTNSYQNGDSIQIGGVDVTLLGTPLSGTEITLNSRQSVDVFASLSSLAATLSQPINAAEEREALKAKIDTAIAWLDRSIDHMVDKQAGVGARMQSLEQQMDTNAGAEIQLQQSLSDLTALDYAEGISRMNQQLLGLQAAQQAFAKVQGLSLFSYL